MNRWLYSTPTDQFGAKPNSMPVPTAPPQRVSLAVPNVTPAQSAAELVVGDGRAALHVPEHVVPGVAHLTGEEAERVDLGVVDQREEGSGRADVRALQVSPIALGFDAEHPVGGLPAIADLTADDCASCIVATFSRDGDRRAGHTGRIPAIVARAATGVAADVEAAPVVDRSDSHRRLGVGASRQIGSRSGASESEQTGRSQENLFHIQQIPVPVSVLDFRASEAASDAVVQLRYVPTPLKPQVVSLKNHNGRKM